MEYENKSFRILESCILSLSLILQFICLVTPGWYIYFRKDLERYNGIFYQTECKRDGVHEEMECETNFYLDILKSSKNEYIGHEEFTYHHRVRLQLLLLLVFALTIACLVVQYFKHKHKKVSFILLITAATMTALGVSGALIISDLSSHYILIDFHLTRSERNDNNTSIGFPYCVLLYTMAIITLCVTLILDIIEIRKVLREHFSQPTRSEGVVMSLLDNNESAAKAT